MVKKRAMRSLREEENVGADAIRSFKEVLGNEKGKKRQKQRNKRKEGVVLGLVWDFAGK